MTILSAIGPDQAIPFDTCSIADCRLISECPVHDCLDYLKPISAWLKGERHWHWHPAESPHEHHNVRPWSLDGLSVTKNPGGSGVAGLLVPDRGLCLPVRTEFAAPWVLGFMQSLMDTGQVQALIRDHAGSGAFHFPLPVVDFVVSLGWEVGGDAYKGQRIRIISGAKGDWEQLKRISRHELAHCVVTTLNIGNIDATGHGPGFEAVLQRIAPFTWREDLFWQPNSYTGRPWLGESAVGHQPGPTPGGGGANVEQATACKLEHCVR